ncbi:hypothetical protein B9Z19DRAFT_1062953 [Tuber borchii]|uniref:Uncharacterized protein n=1 Tax=Tuber borchii TaxID=42251 RepID=A0A2T7A073_TUBBO|nr:hypothetical protein B9Z19DRAFT_1062953 [Tuber borchii]
MIDQPSAEAQIDESSPQTPTDTAGNYQFPSEDPYRAAQKGILMREPTQSSQQRAVYSIDLPHRSHLASSFCDTKVGTPHHTCLGYEAELLSRAQDMSLQEYKDNENTEVGKLERETSKRKRLPAKLAREEAEILAGAGLHGKGERKAAAKANTEARNLAR